MIPVEVPAGNLTVAIVSNCAYKLQVYGSDLDDGEGHVIPIGSVYQNSIDDAEGAIPIGSTAVDILNLGSQPIGAAEHSLFLWISNGLSSRIA